MRRGIAATIATVALVATASPAVGGGAEPPPPPESLLMPGTAWTESAVIGDEAIYVMAPESDQGSKETVLFTRSLAESDTEVTLGRSTRVARASGFSMAEHDGTLAYSRRVDGALVLRAPDGAQMTPVWGTDPMFATFGPTSLSSAWVVAGGTVFDLDSGASYDLLDTVTDLAPDPLYVHIWDVTVSDDRAMWTVAATYGPLDARTEYTYVYTVGLGANGPVGSAVRLEAATTPDDSAIATGMIDGQLVWSERSWEWNAESAHFDETVIVRSVPAAEPTVLPDERAFGPYTYDFEVMHAGDSVAVIAANDSVTWLDPADLSSDLWTTPISMAVWTEATRGSLLATVSDLPGIQGTGMIEDAAGRTITPDISAPAPEATFPDVSPGNPFAANVSWLTDLGITRGYSDGTFRPAGSVNRDAMAAFLYRLAGEPAYTAPATSAFLDVPTSHPFYKEISWLATTGISTGTVTSAGAYYKPGEPVSREAMAAFLHRFAGRPDWAGTPATSPFKDVTTGHPFYAAIAWMAEAEISTGTVTSSGAYYKPGDPVSREAMAAFMNRLHSGGHTISWHVTS